MQYSANPLEQLRQQEPNGFRNEIGVFCGVFTMPQGSETWQVYTLDGYRFAVGNHELAERLRAVITPGNGNRFTVSNARWIDYESGSFELIL